VVVYPFIGCGQCAVCTTDGRDELCGKRAVGFVADGGFATHLLVPHPRYLFPVGRIAPQVTAAAAVIVAVLAVVD
jgi:alcohol dehydrogenase, propanol-preferring